MKPATGWRRRLADALLSPAQVSIKGALLLVLLPGLVTVIAVDVASGYDTVREATDLAYDRALLGSARTLERGIGTGFDEQALRIEVPHEATEVFDASAHPRVYYSVAREEPGASALVTGDAELPRPPPGAQPDGEPVFYDGVYRGQPVRLVALRRPSGTSPHGVLLVRVAETTESRRALRDVLRRAALWRDVRVTVVSALLLWLAVAWAFNPLARLRDDVTSRRGDDLTPLDPTRVPLEVRPLVHAINHHVQQHARIIAAQSRFLADASHQLRTPLAILLTQAEYALREPDVAKVRDSLHAIATQLRRANRLTDQLLALSRAQHHERTEPTEEFDLAELARQGVVDALPLAHERRLDLGWEPQHRGTLTVRANPSFVREALANLLHNAIAHTPEGGEITVRTQADATMARVFVDDSGPGIAPELRERLFERFVSGGPGAGKAAGGSGLGLAIAREFASRYGGQVTLNESVAGGVSAELRLPLSAASRASG